nr:hypothetical protein Itr_chr03CG20940 [Ipomoea trifida]
MFFQLSATLALWISSVFLGMLPPILRSARIGAVSSNSKFHCFSDLQSSSSLDVVKGEAKLPQTRIIGKVLSVSSLPSELNTMIFDFFSNFQLLLMNAIMSSGLSRTGNHTNTMLDFSTISFILSTALISASSRSRVERHLLQKRHHRSCIVAAARTRLDNQPELSIVYGKSCQGHHSFSHP